MNEFKELILKLRDDSESIQKIYEYVKTDPVEVSQMPDESYVVNDGNHRANLLNLLNVDYIPSVIGGEFKLIPTKILRRPNGAIGTQGFTSENMIKLINHILNHKESLFEEIIEDIEKDKKILKSFKLKQNLSPDIFEKKGETYTMKTDIRKKLVEISNNFMDTLGVDFFVHDLILIGSLSNYNWSEYSDVDLHIVIDFDEINKGKKSKIFDTIVDEFFDAKKSIWNKNHDIKIKNYDVEIYVQDIKKGYVSSGVYSILHNKWIKEPKKNILDFDKNKILKKSEEFARQIDYLCDENLSSSEFLKKLDAIRKKLKNFRQSGLENGGEYSYENLTFKLLRRNGYIEKLINLKTRITDKKLSVAQ